MTDFTNVDYYLGLDCGTSSVGFAVTDLKYNVLKFNGKAMWGSHLFDEAKTASERRVARCARRRRKREVRRIKLLQELFAEEIYKVDPTFFIRLNDSKYLIEDKEEKTSNIVFNDSSYTDKDYFKSFPTIYHLSKYLREGKLSDARLLYLGIHHILKHRGHFLFPGEDLQISSNLSQIVEEISGAFPFVFEKCKFEVSDVRRFENCLKIKNKDEKRSLLEEIISVTSDSVSNEKVKANIIKILFGYKVKTDSLFGEESYKDLPAIEFKKTSFEDEDLPVLEDSLSEDEYMLILNFKAIYNWVLLSDIMGDDKFISDAKIKLFEQNKADLKLLKNVIKKYVPDEYNSFFHSDEKDSFSAYVGKNHDNKKRRKFNVERCGVDVFYKKVRWLLDKCDKEDLDVKSIRAKMEDDSFITLLSSFRNGVIPYQVNKYELKFILENAKKYFPFLSVKDEDGLTPAEKILSLLTFRIPYYVGPLGSNRDSSSNAWLVRKEERGRILPWNFNKKVDVDLSAEKFITRMTNKCTYLRDEDVLPAKSYSYQKYLVLQDLNNLRVKGDRLEVSLKQEIYENVFKVNKKVTKKTIVNYFIKEGKFPKGELSVEDISGLADDEFKSSLSTYIDFKPYLESNKIRVSDIDVIVKWITLFPEGGDILNKRLKDKYGNVLTEEEIKKICTFKYSGWGRLSHKFLYGITVHNHEVGQNLSIVSTMWETQYNLMELLSNNYGFLEQLPKKDKIQKLDYSVVDDLYVSPSVKRQIWQTLRVVDEIKRIMKHSPKKVFIETARGKEDKGKITISRRKDIIDKLNDAIKAKDGYGEEFRRILSEINDKTDSQVSVQDKLFLYFQQCGKCMYSGDKIDLDSLYDTNVYDVDHIYPYSKSNDDSLDNKVLVYKVHNARKTNEYPISDDVRQKMMKFWEMLKDRGFISPAKYNRLVRCTPLDQADLEGFINRQIVETRQSTKASAEILKLYLGDDTKIVYSKARNVSEFRNKNNLVKCRTMNNLHHAKDAYLNIVVGNVFDTKYSSEFYKYAWGDDYGNLSKPFGYSVKNAWESGEEGTIKTVKSTMGKNNILYTKQPVEVRGKLFDLQIVPKGSKKGALPIKTSDVRIQKLIKEGHSKTDAYDAWTNKYGGYNSLTTSHFSLVSYEKKGKKYVRFIPISIIDSKELNTKEKLADYCKNELNLSNVNVLYLKLLKNTLVEFDGFRYGITGKANGGDVVLLSSSVPLILSVKSQEYLKKIESFNKKLVTDKNLIVDPNHHGITDESTLFIFKELVDKSKADIYVKRVSNQNKLLLSNEALDEFISLSLNDRCKVITELMNYFGMGNGQANLTLIGGTKACGKLTQGSNIEIDKTSVSVINQSITGLFENIDRI